MNLIGLLNISVKTLQLVKYMETDKKNLKRLSYHHASLMIVQYASLLQARSIEK